MLGVLPVAAQVTAVVCFIAATILSFQDRWRSGLAMAGVAFAALVVALFAQVAA